MQLKFYSDIVGEEERQWLEFFGVQHAVSYQSVKDALDQRDPDDKKIDILINCRGGNCIDGWAIYDLLRQQQGSEISATIEAECSSMASVVLLAAPKERRKAYQNAHLCIHNPAYMSLPLDEYKMRYTAADLDETADKLRQQADVLRDEQRKILAVYVERTGSDEATLQALMDADKYVDMQAAQSLGFIGATIVPVTAKKQAPQTAGAMNNPKTKAMAKTNETKATRFEKLMVALKELVGLADDAPAKMVCLEVTAADGRVLNVEREDGEPQVGDAASPDGTYVMEDGSTIVVDGGVITEINAPASEDEKPADENPADEKPAAEGEDENPDNEDAQELEQLRNEVAELKAEIEQLKAELDEAKSNEKTAEDIAALEAIAKAGGMTAVEKAIKARSTFNASNTKRVERAAKTDEPTAENYGVDYLEERRKKYAAARERIDGK